MEVADIVRLYSAALRRSRALSPEQDRALRDIARCRTAELGGHLDVCACCGFERPAYNSCRNRHCPKCQGLSQARWLEARKTRVLPVHYFHVVFTLPSELHPIARQNRRLVFDLLFEAASASLLELGCDPKRLGAQLGITAVLHTWTRELCFHPHIHCIVTGGGLSVDGTRWIGTRPDYLFPVRVLGALFRGKFLGALVAARDAGKLGGASDLVAWKRLLETLYRHRWVVYCKPPFGGSDQLFAYLGRYTHRVAISNARLVSMDEHGVRFKTRNGNSIVLAPIEFLRRFLSHVLPPGFVKIRHYGLHASGNATSRLAQARALLEATSRSRLSSSSTTPANDSTRTLTWRELFAELTGVELDLCPQCGQLAMRRIALPDNTANASRAPPPLVRCA